MYSFRVRFKFWYWGGIHSIPFKNGLWILIENRIFIFKSPANWAFFRTPKSAPLLLLLVSFSCDFQMTPHSGSQSERTVTPDNWPLHPPGQISPDVSANVLVGVENLLPPWGSAKSDDVTSPSASSAAAQPPSGGLRTLAGPITPISISIPNGGLHGPQPPLPFSPPWTFPVITPLYPVTSAVCVREPPASSSSACSQGYFGAQALLQPLPQAPPSASGATFEPPEKGHVALRPRPEGGSDPAVVARRKSAEGLLPPPRG